MFYDRRIIWKNNTTPVDITIAVTGPTAASVVIDYVAADDKIYVGSIYPFNHLYFDFAVVNATTVTPSVRMWNGSSWVSTVDLIDETDGWKQAGKISWNVPRETSWHRELDSFDVDGLTGTVIYNFYWAELSFSGDLTGTTDLKYVGQLFSTNSDLFTMYPDLNKTALMEQYEAGKTNWTRECILGTESCLSYLKAKNIIKGDSSIMRPDLLKVACIHKTAQMIYSSFGEAYKDDWKRAGDAFNEAISMKFYQTDVDSTGELSLEERQIPTGKLIR